MGLEDPRRPHSHDWSPGSGCRLGHLSSLPHGLFFQLESLDFPKEQLCPERLTLNTKAARSLKA